MDKREKTRRELGCFDSFQSNFLKELHKIRERQAQETRGKSSKEVAEHIHSRAEKIREKK
jgi:hypothetical protein